jgi:hypothetical protein
MPLFGRKTSKPAGASLAERETALGLREPAEPAPTMTAPPVLPPGMGEPAEATIPAARPMNPHYQSYNLRDALKESRRLQDIYLLTTGDAVQMRRGAAWILAASGNVVQVIESATPGRYLVAVSLPVEPYAALEGKEWWTEGGDGPLSSRVRAGGLSPELRLWQPLPQDYQDRPDVPYPEPGSVYPPGLEPPEQTAAPAQVLAGARQAGLL